MANTKNDLARVLRLTINKKRIRVGYYGSESEAIVAKDKYLTH